VARTSRNDLAASCVGKPADSGDVSPAAALASYVCLGHVTRDLTPSGWAFGGTAFFAAKAAAALGERVATVTRLRAADASVLAAEHHHVTWHARPSTHTTTFQNLYASTGRRQGMLERAAPIRPADAASACRGARVVHLAPVAGEFGPSILCAIPGPSFVGVTAQGWVRARQTTGEVRWRPWRPRRAILARASVVILSEEDIRGDAEAGIAYLRQARLGILTRGPQALIVFQAGERTEVPVRPARERNPLAAGDVFAAALFIELSRGTPLARATAFACAAAALLVGRLDPLAFPPRAAAERRLRACTSTF